MKQIIHEIETRANLVSEQELNKFVEILHQHRLHDVCGFGAGRMGYALRAFLMRLDHIGFRSFMIGDTNFPRINENTLVLINSSSGETPSIRLFTEQAKAAGSTIVTFTSGMESSIARLSDLIVFCGDNSSKQIMKTLNEQFSFLLFDYIAAKYIETYSLDEEWISNNHSISE